MSEDEAGHTVLRLTLDDYSIIRDKFKQRSADVDFEIRLSIVEKKVEQLEKR